MAQPALADARIACPVCRAPVHPIAGRCKHCKADLVRMRGGSTGAGETPVAIPMLGAGGAPAAAPMPMPGARHGGAMPALAGPGGTPQPALPAAPGHAALPGPAPMLALPASAAPAGPTSTMSTSAEWPRTRRWTQRWPLAVAIVAALAILASLAVLLFNEPKKPKHLRTLGPAPERMDTDVGPPAAPTPTPRPPASGAPTPPPAAPGAPADPAPQADPTDPTDPTDPSDPFDPPTATGPGAAPADPAPRAPGAIPDVGDAGEFLSAAIDLGCERVLACSNSSADAQALCTQARSMRDSAATALGLSCTHFDAPSARTCLGAIARIPCPGNGTTDPSKLAALLMGVPACARVCGP